MKKILFLLFCISIIGFKVYSQEWITYNSTNTSNKLPNNYIQAIAIDNQGNKWFGSNGTGVTKFDGTNWATYTTANGYVNDYIYRIEKAPNGNLWFGTDGGLSKLSGTQITNYTTADGLAGNMISAIAFDSIGNVWVGTSTGISKFDGVTWTTYSITNGLVNNSVSSIVIDNFGNKWIGTQNGISKFNGSSWTTYNTSNTSLGSNYIRAIVIDKKKNIWFCTYGGGVTRYNGYNWKTYKSTDGLCDNKINAVAIDMSGDLWFGGDTYGVSKYNGSTWSTYNTSNSGLAQNVILSIRAENNGHIWFGLWGQGISNYNKLFNYKLDLGADKYICAGLPAILHAENWFSTYLWSNGSTSDSVVIDSSGVGLGVKKIKLIVTLQTQNYSDSIYIHFVKPKAVIGADKIVCFNDQVEIIATGGVAYLWNTGETTSTINFAAKKTTRYFLTVTDQYGCTDTASILVNVNPRPSKPNIVILGNGTFKSSISGSSYIWLLNKARISDVTQYISPKQSGIYQLIVYFGNCSSDTSAGIEFQSSRINLPFAEKQVQVSPNPADDIILIDLHNFDYSKSKLEIVSLLGKMIYYSDKLNEKNEIHVSNLTKGFYYLKLFCNGKTYLTKFVVQ